jgi:hypothetical protein
MIVRMQNKGRSITGIRIAKADARRYFPDGTKAIDLELDHLRIRCDLNDSFWRGCPEISDSRLGAWLEAKSFGNELASSRVSVQLERTGDCYRLHLLSTEQHASRAGFGLTV